MSNLLIHAKNELKLIGYIPLDEEQEDGPNKWVQENILELLEVFAKQGHSGTSAQYCSGMFYKLSNFEPLSPLTGEDSEWEKIDYRTWQNVRSSRVFKEVNPDNTFSYFDVQGKVFEESDGARYTSNDSRVEISFPYLPKTEIVKV